MDWQDKIYCQPILKLSTYNMASMDFFDSDMYNRTNTGVHFDGKGGNIYLRLRGRSNTIYATQVDCSRGCSGSQKVGARKIVKVSFSGAIFEIQEPV
jgi:hypothetical protein